MVYNETKNYQSLITYEGLTALVKTADHIGYFGNENKVITSLVVVKENNEIAFKYSHNLWICYYEEKDGFSIIPIIEDILYFIKYYKESYYKEKFLLDVLNNKLSALMFIKRFKKENEEKIAEEKRQIEAKKTDDKIKNIKNEICITIDKINKYTGMRYEQPNENNNYKHIFYTKYSVKKFQNSYGKEGIQTHLNILNHLEKYLDYLQSDLIPENFMKFDKIA